MVDAEAGMTAPRTMQNATARHGPDIWEQHRLRPTLEVLVKESPAHLRKVDDPVTWLALIRSEK
jgi:hypothetical protein